MPSLQQLSLRTSPILNEKRMQCRQVSRVRPPLARPPPPPQSRAVGTPGQREGVVGLAGSEV